MSMPKEKFHRIIDLLPEDRYEKLVKALPKIIFEGEKDSDDLTSDELTEILAEANKAKEEVAKGEYATYDEVFGDLSNDV
ncbi:hypothetical protein [Effusibacillus lacus]|uniref:Uncharacterized protein n=1 Tax=Effusibacillus lacus TaxID=1348429 RepID=A0A292YQT3_9BACL|nr:hypothetical protein [Effusibacillus lacus]TCS71122.1 hypothetical protein EDD64_12867 [Effusibacillus lacus]GAX90764.1 hypothetical protein EFBL_2405 [Effusibacillus lacus]